jgi:hypothetical protein
MDIVDGLHLLQDKINGFEIWEHYVIIHLPGQAMMFHLEGMTRTGQEGPSFEVGKVDLEVIKKMLTEHMSGKRLFSIQPYE